MISDSGVTSDRGNITIQANDELQLAEQARIMNIDGQIQLDGDRIALSNSQLQNETGGIQLLADDSISLAQGTTITGLGPGDLALQGDRITLADSSITSRNDSGDLSLSGGSLALTNATILKDSLNRVVTPARLDLRFQGPISLAQNSTIQARNSLQFTLDVDRIQLDESDNEISYSENSVAFDSARTALGAYGFPCSSGLCRYSLLSPPSPPAEPIPGPVPGPAPGPVPGPPSVSLLPMVEPESRRVPVTMALMPYRQATEPNALPLRCEGPIPRQVIFQRSGRGGLLPTPGSSPSGPIFQDFGGMNPSGVVVRSAAGIAPSTPSPAPANPAVSSPEPHLEAQNWQLDPQGRITLMAAVPVPGDRTAQYCPELSPSR